MLIIKQYRIYRKDLQANKKCLYIFGDNLQRIGYGGQAKEMRGEPNAFGVATKRKAAHGTPDCYFHDKESDAWKAVEVDIDKLEDEIMYNAIHEYEAVILPMDGIGTGLASLTKYAPNLLQYISNRLNQLGTIEL